MGKDVDCTRWRELASDYIEGSLPAPAEEAVRAHTATCAVCRLDEAALRSLSRELNVLPEVDPPLFFRDNVMAAIERENARAPRGPWWKMLPHLSRLAVGTAMATGAAAIIVFSAMAPGARQQSSDSAARIAPAAAVPAPFVNVLPDADADAVTRSPARLRIARVTTVDPGSDGPAYDFSLWLENAEGGTARFQLIGDRERAFRFNLTAGGAPQTLRVPFAAVSGKDTLGLEVFWTADTKSHTRRLFVPLPQEGAAVPEERQSYGMPEGTLAEVGQQISTRYGIPVTLDDVPEGLRVTVVARSETAQEALQRALTPHGLQVTQSQSGLLIEKAPSAASLPAAP